MSKTNQSKSLVSEYEQSTKEECRMDNDIVCLDDSGNWLEFTTEVCISMVTIIPWG